MIFIKGMNPNPPGGAEFPEWHDPFFDHRSEAAAVKHGAINVPDKNDERRLSKQAGGGLPWEFRVRFHSRWESDAVDGLQALKGCPSTVVEKTPAQLRLKASMTVVFLGFRNQH